jgi:hypothetical protein
MDDTFRRLAKIGEAKSDGDQRDYLINATNQIIGVPELITAYHAAVIRQDRSFKSLVSFIRLHAPDQAVSTAQAGYAGSAARSQAQAIQEAVAEALRLERLAVATRTSKATRPGSRREKTVRSNLYCYLHGHKGHSGKECRNMKADIRYTQAMIEATSQGDVAGGCED